jgi:hypothetical protein
MHGGRFGILLDASSEFETAGCSLCTFGEGARSNLFERRGAGNQIKGGFTGENLRIAKVAELRFIAAFKSIQEGIAHRKLMAHSKGLNSNHPALWQAVKYEHGDSSLPAAKIQHPLCFRVRTNSSPGKEHIIGSRAVSTLLLYDAKRARKRIESFIRINEGLGHSSSGNS